MEPRRLRACEALTEALVRKCCNGSDFVQATLELNSQQQAMNIPPYLVYLCGLLGEINPPFSSETKDVFAKLQTLYHTTNASQRDTAGTAYPTKLFHLSPSLLPSPTDRVRIQQEIEEKMLQLEEEAEHGQKQLIENANQEAKTKQQAKKTKKAAPKRHPKAAPQVDDHNNEESAKENPTETLQQVLTQIQMPRTETDDDTNDDSWVEVGKKSKPHTKFKESTKASTTIESAAEIPQGYESLLSDASEGLPDDEIGPPREDAKKNDTAVLSNSNRNDGLDGEATTATEREDGSPGKAMEEPMGLMCTEHISRGETSLSSRNDPTEDNNVEELQERVEELEEALAQSQRERKELEMKHMKELRTEREQSEERLQAVQLRLYISETRLKTYEDALEQHVVAVANNTASGSCPDHHISSRNVAGSPATRPLSRVLNQYSS